MDIGRALTFFTEDERWIEKTAIGTGVILLSSVLSIVLVGLLGVFVVMGYSIRLMQNVRDDVQPVLPEWDQWGEDLVRGVKYLVVNLIWALPLILIAVPIFIIAVVAGEGGGQGEGIAAILMLCATCLTTLLGLGLVLLQPGFTVAFARREEISDALQVSEIWRWTRENLSPVALVVIVYLVGSLLISMVASLAGTILCLVGLVVTIPLGQLIVYYFQYHLYGQLARETGGGAGRANYGEEPDIPPIDPAPMDPPPVDPQVGI